MNTEGGRFIPYKLAMHLIQPHPWPQLRCNFGQECSCLQKMQLYPHRASTKVRTKDGAKSTHTVLQLIQKVLDHRFVALTAPKMAPPAIVELLSVNVHCLAFKVAPFCSMWTHSQLVAHLFYEKRTFSICIRAMMNGCNDHTDNSCKKLKYQGSLIAWKIAIPLAL